MTLSYAFSIVYLVALGFAFVLGKKQTRIKVEQGVDTYWLFGFTTLVSTFFFVCTQLDHFSPIEHQAFRIGSVLMALMNLFLAFLSGIRYKQQHG